jgi:hypothetical protein
MSAFPSFSGQKVVPPYRISATVLPKPTTVSENDCSQPRPVSRHPSAFGRQGAAGSARLSRLADNFVLLSGAGGNILAVRGPEGILLVDWWLPERYLGCP